MDLINHPSPRGPTRKGAPGARLVCYAFRANADVPFVEVKVDGSLGRAKARAKALFAACPASQFIEIFRGDTCLLRMTRAPLPCAI